MHVAKANHNRIDLGFANGAVVLLQNAQGRRVFNEAGVGLDQPKDYPELDQVLGSFPLWKICEIFYTRDASRQGE